MTRIKWVGPKKIKPEPALVESLQREWRILCEFPDYEISNDGRLRRKTPGSNTKAGAHIRVCAGNYPHLIWKHISNPAYCAMLENGRKADVATT
jgi:hypothetical protein